MSMQFSVGPLTNFSLFILNTLSCIIIGGYCSDSPTNGMVTVTKRIWNVFQKIFEDGHWKLRASLYLRMISLSTKISRTFYGICNKQSPFGGTELNLVLHQPKAVYIIFNHSKFKQISVDCRKLHFYCNSYKLLLILLSFFFRHKKVRKFQINIIFSSKIWIDFKS